MHMYENVINFSLWYQKILLFVYAAYVYMNIVCVYRFVAISNAAYALNSVYWLCC